MTSEEGAVGVWTAQVSGLVVVGSENTRVGQ